MAERTDGTRWVVVHNGARDGYQLALALEEAGALEALVTDWYSPLDRAWFRALAPLLPRGARASLARRFRPGLPSRRVRSRPAELARLRLGGTPHALDLRLGGYAGRLAAQRGAGVFAVSYYAHGAFTAPGAGRLPRLIHQIHPHPGSLRALYLDEMRRVPGAASLADEYEVRVEAERFEQLSGEARMADLCVASSGFTARTLAENGVDPARIRVVPYGVDLETLAPSLGRRSGPFRVLFVGQMVHRKGLAYLLEAWRSLGLAGAELVLAGRGGHDRALLSRYEGSFRLVGDVSPRALRELYRASDVLCVPSLAEGFGLVYLEALACGTPVIGTVNTGAADVVTEGEDGWVVDVRSAEAIAARLRWCHDHRDELAAMRPAARRKAEGFTWERFRRSVAAVAREAGGGRG